MSRDIHAWFEYRNGDEPWRVSKTEIYLAANHYFLFDIMTSQGRGALGDVLVEAYKHDKETTERAMNDLEEKYELLYFKERGLPLDVTTYVQKQYDAYASDAHTSSWLSYVDMIVVTDIYDHFPAYENKKDRWSIKLFRTWQTLARAYGTQDPKAEKVWDRMMEQSVQTSREDARLRHVMVRMSNLKKRYDDVRIVFFFDN